MDRKVDTENHSTMLEEIENMDLGGEVTIRTKNGDKLNRAVRSVVGNGVKIGDPMNTRTHRLLEESNGDLVAKKLKEDGYDRGHKVTQLIIWNYSKLELIKN